MKKVEEVSLVRNGIHRTGEPRHYMRVKENANMVTASYKGKLIASSSGSLNLQEVEYDFYEPVCYFPREDVNMAAIVGTSDYSRCPLKGDSEALHVIVEGELLERAAWSYTKPIDKAYMIKDYVAFDASRVQIIKHV